MASKRIVWQKWVDPYDIEEEQDFEPKSTTNEDDMPFDFEDGTPNPFMSQHMSMKPLKKPMKLIMTPLGAIPITEHSMPGKVFNFWMAHTNFNITNDIGNIVEQTDGVETLDIFTRYRMRVGVGKAFDDGGVLRQIDKNIAVYLNRPKKKKKIKPSAKTFNIFDEHNHD